MTRQLIIAVIVPSPQSDCPQFLHVMFVRSVLAHHHGQGVQVPARDSLHPDILHSKADEDLSALQVLSFPA